MKRGLALFGLLGVVGCFLPLVPGFSLFDARAFDALEVYLVIAAFLVPLVIGAADKLSVAGSALATVSFGFVAWKFGIRGTFDLLWHASIGGKMMAVAAVGGFVTALGSFADAKR